MIRNFLRISACTNVIQRRAINSISSFITEMHKNRHFTDEEGFFWKSPYEKPENCNMIIHEHIWKDLTTWKDHIALECAETGRKYTFSQFRDSCAAFAVNLKQIYGLQKGDVIALFLPNLPEFLIALLGAIEAGITVSTINPIYTPDELAKQIRLVKPKIIIGIPKNYKNISKACEMENMTPKTILIRTFEQEPIPNETVNFSELIEKRGNNFDILGKIEHHPDDVCVLPFSSGTTGAPKGVMLTHRNFVAAAQIFNAKLPFETLSQTATKLTQETWLAILPLFHIAGLVNNALPNLAIGCKIVTFPKFKSETFLNGILKYRPPALTIVPPIFLLLANRPEVTEKYFKHMRTILCGAACLGELDVRRLLQKSGPNLEYVQVYGLSETCGGSIVAPKEISHLSSIGWAGSGTEVKIAENDGTKYSGLDINELGEVLIRGPCVMKGYYKNSEATENTITSNGWLRTGDLGCYDKDGFIYIKDRLKELIKVKGFQVAPAELEEILRDHPMVADAAVTGIPDERCGELPKAFVVLKSNSKISEKELQNYVASKVVSFKHLNGGICFLDSIPKTQSGKILRRNLKNL